MISKKQMWKYQKKRVHRLGSDQQYKLSMEYEPELCPSRRSLSDSAIQSSTSTQSPEIVQQQANAEMARRNSWSSEQESSKKRRGVKFGSQQHVVLIPTREEYKKADIDSCLWWDSCELNSFKQSATEEILSIMRSHNIDLCYAKKMLYQPSYHHVTFHPTSRSVISRL